MILGTKEQLLRFSFVSVFETKSIDGGDPKYSVQVLVDKKHLAIVSQINDGINTAITAGITKGLFTKVATNNAAFKRCLRDGDAEAAEAVEGKKDYLKGHWFFNASCNEKNPPAVVDQFMKPIISEHTFYSGCYGVADINFFPFKFGKGGVSAGLNSIMKRADGDHLDGRMSANMAFADLKEDLDSCEDSEDGQLI